MSGIAIRPLTRLLMLGVIAAGSCWGLLLGGLARSVIWGPPIPARPLPRASTGEDMAPAVPLERFSAVWRRPLLAPDRRPSHNQGGGAGMGDFRLTGVIITPGLRLVLLRPKAVPAPAGSARGPELPTTRLKLGERLGSGPWQLIRLEPRQAWFAASGQELSLTLEPPVTGVARNKRPAIETDDAGRRQALREAVQRLQARPVPAGSPIH